MGIRFKDAVKNIEQDDLLKIAKDIESGGIHIKNLVKEQIKENEKHHDITCSNCMTPIDPHNPQTFTLIFGPDDFRKKATFCAVDCLEFFIQKLKVVQKK